jgi:hypothetical protein
VVFIGDNDNLRNDFLQVAIMANKSHNGSMSKSSLEIIPRRVKAFGRLWAVKFIATHPRWKTGDPSFEDEWHSFGDYDINLYCDDGYLSVCAYAMYEDEDGFMNTDHSNYVYLVRKGNIQ